MNDSLEASFNLDTMDVTKHTVIRPTGKDMRRHARKHILICLNKKTFLLFKNMS